MEKLNSVILLLVLRPRLETLAEIFNSLAAMEVLIKTEADVIRSFEDYIGEERKNINLVQEYLRRSIKEHGKAKTEFSYYFGNPINSFMALTRMTRGLDVIKNVTKIRTGYFRDRTQICPSKADLIGATEAIAQMQVVYRMNITLLANGTLISSHSESNEIYTEYVTPMSSSDCYYIGLVSDEKQGNSGQLMWMKEALNKYHRETSPFRLISGKKIAIKISRAYFGMESYKKALKWLEKAHKWPSAYGGEENNSTELILLMQDLQKRIDNGEGLKTKRERKIAWKQPKPKKLFGCYDDLKIPLAASDGRISTYVGRGVPSVPISPIKTEFLSFVPPVLKYYDVISDDEIEELIRMIKPKLTTAKVIGKQPNSNSLAVLYSDGRIAQFALADPETPLAQKLARRIAYICELNMHRSEFLVTVNYGIAGYYVEHIDSLQVINGTTPGYGDRSNAIVIFLSDVEQGGALVFPTLGLKIYPKKGTAVSWDVIFPSGEAVIAAGHTSCPVIRGSKWVSIIWTNFNDQVDCPVWHVNGSLVTEELHAKWAEEQKRFIEKAKGSVLYKLNT